MAKEGVFVYREEFGAEGFQGRGGCSHDETMMWSRASRRVVRALSLSLSLFSPLGRHAGGPRRPPREKNDDTDDVDALEICVHRKKEPPPRLHKHNRETRKYTRHIKLAQQSIHPSIEDDDDVNALRRRRARWTSRSKVRRCTTFYHDGREK